MLNKKMIFLLLLLSFTYFVTAQSNWSVDIGGGVTSIKEDASSSGFAGVVYQVSPRIKLNLNTLYAKPKYSEQDSNKYNFNQYSLEVEYAFIEESKLAIVPIVGFSFLHFGSDIDLESNNGLGINTGFSITYDDNKYFRYGMKLTNTYSSISYGGILSTSLFLRFNL